ncbi:hypothetical protein AAL_04496 [Moelleriella libera RCEF 2490]|uniref:Uncharacterized protein n=1 Tax=Moelleriella libera RCEF 2490 TaxID=1081109 RepID=A0A168BG41_9HYPO|nr:hypothetical protein AAL_04496 [Moelleriella libera RCEF 2490]
MTAESTASSTASGSIGSSSTATTTTTTTTTTTSAPGATSLNITTTLPLTTYSLTLNPWDGLGMDGGGPPDGASSGLGDRILQLVTGGSSGERIVRGFLMGIAIGIILGGVLCCWVPCFGRRRVRELRERRRRRRRREQRRRERERQLQLGLGDADDDEYGRGGGGGGAGRGGHLPILEGLRTHWDRIRRRRPRLWS